MFLILSCLIIKLIIHNYLIYLHLYSSHSAHFGKTIRFLLFFFATEEFLLSVFFFFYTLNNTKALLYKSVKVFDELLKFTIFWFFLSYYYILLTHYLLNKNSTRIQYDSIKALEVNNSMVFNLVFTNSTIYRVLFFFLDYWLILLISPYIEHLISPEEIAMPLEISAKETIEEI